MKRIYLIALLCVCAISGQAADTSYIKKYSPNELREDLSHMVTLIDEVHPNMYHSINRAEFQRRLDSIKSSITDSLTEMEAWPKFATLVGLINEGHTGIGLPREIDGNTLLLPIQFSEITPHGIVVRLDLSMEQKLSPGDIVSEINGVNANSIANRITKFVGGLPTYKNLLVATYLNYYLAICRIQSPYTIRFSRNGKSEEITIGGIQRNSLKSRQAKLKGGSATLDPYEFSALSKRIGYLNFRSMSDAATFSKFLDSVFRKIKVERFRGLIVDLRENGGGNSILGDKLLEYLTRKSYRMSAGSKWKISQPYKDYYNQLPENQKFLKASGLESTYLNGSNGSFLERKVATKKPSMQRNQFRGRICFLIGAKTFSSASMLANAVKDFSLATIIGEPTGECPNDYGEVFSFSLPNTGIAISTSTKQYIRANADAYDRNPVLPDIKVRDNLETSKDEILEAAVKWIGTGRQK